MGVVVKSKSKKKKKRSVVAENITEVTVEEPQTLEDVSPALASEEKQTDEVVEQRSREPSFNTQIASVISSVVESKEFAEDIAEPNQKPQRSEPALQTVEPAPEQAELSSEPAEPTLLNVEPAPEAASEIV